MHQIFIILGLAAVAKAVNPLLVHRQIVSADAQDYLSCLDPTNSSPNVKSTSCTPKNVMDAHGDCANLTQANQCSAYCQVSVSWNYGTEVPFQGTYCQKDDNLCTITNTATTSVGNSQEFSVGLSVGNKRSLVQREPGAAAPANPLSALALKATFNAGASWTYSDTYTNATAMAASRPDLAKAKCGYFTFVPYYVTSCGSITKGTWIDGGQNVQAPPGTTTEGGCYHKQTTGNWCQTVPMQDANGRPLGETFFVAVSCCGHWPIGWCRQNSIYLIPGVSNNATIYNDYVISHQDYDMSKGIESYSNITCMAGERPYNEDNGQSGSSGAPACQVA